MLCVLFLTQREHEGKMKMIQQEEEDKWAELASCRQTKVMKSSKKLFLSLKGQQLVS